MPVAEQFKNKFDLLDDEVIANVRKELEENGIPETLKKYKTYIMRTTGISLHGLKERLKREYKKLGGMLPNTPSRYVVPKSPNSLTLGTQEEDFLSKFEEGKVSLEDVSRMMAVRLFRRMLENPDEIKYADFIRTEMLKMKQNEQTQKNDAKDKIINRLFSGYLHTQCPHCSKALYPEFEQVNVLEKMMEKDSKEDGEDVA